MNFIERAALKMALKRVEGKMGSNWKGKAGAVVGMLSSAAVLLAGLSCAVTALTNGQIDHVFDCWQQIAAGAAGFGVAFSAFGIRDAIGKVEAK